MRYLLILFLLCTSCGVYKTQYYLHETYEIPISLIDSINCTQNIHIPLNFDLMRRTAVKGDDWYVMYHYTELKKDTLYVFSVTVPKEEQRYIIKLRKELYK